MLVFSTYVDRGKVRFEGRVPNVDAPVYYRAADVYLMTSDFEAFSRVLLESMAMGTPYVATDGGGSIRAYTPEEHQEFIVPVSNIDEFPRKIERILDDSSVRKSLIDSGLNHVQAYFLDVVLDQFIKEICSNLNSTFLNLDQAPLLILSSSYFDLPPLSSSCQFLNVLSSSYFLI